MRNAVHALGACGLVAREGRPARLVLTPEARRFLVSEDDLYLLAVLHANVRFVGEALAALGKGLTHPELNAVAAEEYGLPWNTLDQVRRRVYWFRAAELVDYWTNGLIVPTERGRQFLELVEPVDPDQLPHRRRAPSQAIELPPPPHSLALALSDADQAALRSRKRQVGYIAGGTRTEVLARLLDAAVPEIRRTDFLTFCAEEFDVLESSAEQTLGTLRSLGLLTQVGSDTFAATERTVDCLASGEPLDFIRLLHLHVALLGETLDALEGGTSSAALARLLADRYPETGLTREDVTRRLALFLETGLAERIGLAVRRTELGTALVRTLPLLARADSDGQEDTGGGAAEASRQGSSSPGDGAASPDHGRLAAEILAASVDSADYRRFERAIAAAFQALGVKAEHIGGPDRTDVVIELWQSPTDRRRVAVEAKTDGAGLLTGRDVEFWSLGKHRERHGAQSTVLIGPRFDARLTEEAEKEKVALLTASELANALLRHGRTPLAPHELTALVTYGEAESLALTWQAAERRQETLSLVLDTLWKSGNDPVDIEYTAGALNAGDIWRETKGTLETPLDQAEIEAALAFLEAPFVAGVVQREKGKHVVTAPPSLLAARLRALAAAIENRPAGKADARATPPPPVRPDAGSSARTPAPRQAPDDVPASLVRAWAKSRGRAVNPRGRLPEHLVREYKQAHGLE
ncbi:restriction endonuclease [Streptomyces sp. CC208A]|uniref:Lsr2 family DNA-binding protein n=1 Tax=Streptomyces sp. CC208A TaxID=3044573 RepID=UPI0024A7EFA8|nr:restriction endonuclease [Streptomyces sp. CC208A]